MAKDPFVYNETRDCLLRLKQAEKGVESCAFAWVIPGKRIRQLNYAESRSALNRQAKERKTGQEILVSPEIPGVHFDGPITSTRVGRELYEELDSPLALKSCHWPRRSAA